ncbi:hypothetical protein ANN_17014 [Periplaneta americana]|uniref:Uncharacterized protein n=1 Tax=Periplaneta americana TaxID=6978 RepID=A0ABQ8ST71_PERAM|nr:hypothetical protein ANN_17014 [Periplaneta americana]
MSPGSSTESYPASARIGLRENPGKNLNQLTCPDRDSNPGHLVSRPDALTVTPQMWTMLCIVPGITHRSGSRHRRARMIVEYWWDDDNDNDDDDDDDGKRKSRAVASWSKRSCLGIALRNARWFKSSWGKEFSHGISSSVWDRCPPSIVMHLGSYDRRGDDTKGYATGTILFVTSQPCLPRDGLPHLNSQDIEDLRRIFWAKRDEVTGEWRKLRNAELHALYPSPDIIRNIKSRRLRWAGHVARMGESGNAYRVLVGRPEGKRPLGMPRRRWGR